MRKFVRGGSEEARLVPYEGEDMAKREKLTDKERQGIYTMHCMGESNDAIADRYEIAVSTVYRIVREQRRKKEEEGMAGGQQIVAGNKANGRLMSCSDRNRFEGTCIVGGKSKKRTFTAVNAKNAKDQWEKWCQTLRDEQAFMNMVERKVDAVAEDAEPESANVVCGYPGDPIEEIRPIQAIEPAPTPDIDVRPWREVAEERQQRIDELEEKVRELEEATYRKPVYVVWARAETPKMFGAYASMEQALKTLDELNDVAAFLGNGSAFEVEEVAWR